MNDVSRKRNVLIIAEGFEEKPYLDKILSFPNIRKDIYNFAPVVNVKGSGRIDARFQYEIQRGFYDIVLIFCDADKGSDDFLKLVEKLDCFFKEKYNSLNVIIFANPVTLQIVLSHYGDVSLTSSAKRTNSPIVKALTGIDNYDAKEEQIKEMIDGIYYHSIDDFKRRLSKISNNFEDIPSTNFLLFLERFESDDTSWIDDVNSLRKK